MALKITTAIGTDKGITSEAYVRIADYQVSKYGSANFRIEIYQSQDDISSPGSATFPTNGGQARNQQIGESLYVALTKQEEKTVTGKRMMQVEIPATEEGGQPTYEMQEQDYEETVTVTVPDLSALEEGTIFQFAYGHLKAKLEGLFGAENVVDC